MSFDLLSLTIANLTSKALLQECGPECLCPADFLLGIVLSWFVIVVVLHDDYLIVELFLDLVEGVEWLLWGGNGGGGLLRWYGFVQRGVLGGVLT